MTTQRLTGSDPKQSPLRRNTSDWSGTSTPIWQTRRQQVSAGAGRAPAVHIRTPRPLPYAAAFLSQLGDQMAEAVAYLGAVGALAAHTASRQVVNPCDCPDRLTEPFTSTDRELRSKLCLLYRRPKGWRTFWPIDCDQIDPGHESCPASLEHPPL